MHCIRSVCEFYYINLDQEYIARDLYEIPHIRRIFRAKNIKATLLFADISKAFDSIHRGKVEQIILTYGLSAKTVTAIMILNKDMKVKVRMETGFFDIVASVLPGYTTLALYLFITCLDYVLRTSIDLIKENGFTLYKRVSLK